MSLISTRARLLGGAALGLGLTAAIATPAQATCDVTASSVTCASTTTTDTVNAGGTPASDRSYSVDTSAGAFTATVNAGATVDGYGLSFYNFAGSNDLNVVNDGLVQVDAASTPTGDGALIAWANGATNIVYSGTGSVAQLAGGTYGNGLVLGSSGTGNITADVGGDVTGTGGTSNGIGAFQDGTAGNIRVTTAAGTNIRAGHAGIFAEVSDVSSVGTITVTNAASILSDTAVPNSLFNGVEVDAYGLGAVSVVNNGTIGSAADTTSGNGIFAAGYNSSSTAALSVTGSGAIYSAGDGIEAYTNGTGAVTVDYSGAINSGEDGLYAASNGAVTVTSSGAIGAGGNGIEASTDSGNLLVTANGAIDAGNDGIYAETGSGSLTVTTGAAVDASWSGIDTFSDSGDQLITVGGAVTSGAEAVYASSNTGDITVNLNANVTSSNIDAVTLSTDGASVVNVQAGRTVTGITNVIEFYANVGTSTATLNNSGTIGSATSGAAVFTDYATQTTVNNLAGGVINGRYDLSDSGDTLNNAGTLNIRSNSSFYLGTDAINNQAGGVINLASGTTVTGLEAYNNAAGSVSNVAGTAGFGGATLTNAGTWNLAAGSAATGLGVVSNSGTLSAAAGSSMGNSGNFSNAAAGTFTTAGAFSLTTTGAFSNAGTLVLAPATFTLAGATAFTNSGTIRAEGGATGLVTPVNLANSGTLDLQDGAAGDVLTVTGNFVGSGGSALSLDLVGNAADKLVVTGAASGSTQLNVTATGTVTLDLNGVLVVDTGTSTANAFVLNAAGGGPLVEFQLEQRGEDYYLVAAPTTVAFDAVALPGMAIDLWTQSADVYSNYAAAKRSDLNRGKSGMGAWGQAYLSSDRYGDDRVDTDRRGLQGGVDYNFGRAVLGVTAGWQKAGMERDASGTGFDAKGWNVGVYGLAGGDLGLYGGLLVKYDSSNADASKNGSLAGVKNVSLKSKGAEAELGYRFGSGRVRVDLGGGLAWVSSKIEDFTLAPVTFDADTAKSLRGRVGFRVDGAASWGPFVSAELLYEFNDNNRMAMVSGGNTEKFKSEGRGTWARFEAGAGSNGGAGPLAAVWFNAGDVQGAGVKLGWRF